MMLCFAFASLFWVYMLQTIVPNPILFVVLLRFWYRWICDGTNTNSIAGWLKIISFLLFGFLAGQLRTYRSNPK